MTLIDPVFMLSFLSVRHLRDSSFNESLAIHERSLEDDRGESRVFSWAGRSVPPLLSELITSGKFFDGSVLDTASERQ